MDRITHLQVAQLLGMVEEAHIYLGYLDVPPILLVGLLMVQLHILEQLQYIQRVVQQVIIRPSQILQKMKETY